MKCTSMACPRMGLAASTAECVAIEVKHVEAASPILGHAMDVHFIIAAHFQPIIVFLIREGDFPENAAIFVAQPRQETVIDLDKPSVLTPQDKNTAVFCKIDLGISDCRTPLHGASVGMECIHCSASVNAGMQFFVQCEQSSVSANCRQPAATGRGEGL